MFTNKNITIFGGTGSIGTLITEKLLSDYDANEITLFCNNENELWESRNKFGIGPYAFDNINLVFGDIRNKSAVKKVVENADFVFNCAALKHIGFCEQSPIDAVYTNLIGLQNIINACNKYEVDLMVQISTDKAVEPTSVMGATKLIGERMCRDEGCKKIIIRLGNVLGSRGSLIPQMEEYMKQERKCIYLTNPKMRRYFITQEDLGDFIMDVCSLKNNNQATIYIPKMKEYEIVKIVSKFLEERGLKPDTEIVIFGEGEAEKLTEALFSQSEANLIQEYETMYVIEGIPT